MTDTTINVVTLEGAKLALSAGDTLAIMYPRILTQDQRTQIKAMCAESLPEGVKVAVFDGGVTIAAIKQPKHFVVKRRCLVMRIYHAYSDYRQYFGVRDSLRSAWLVSTAH